MATHSKNRRNYTTFVQDADGTICLRTVSQSFEKFLKIICTLIGIALSIVGLFFILRTPIAVLPYLIGVIFLITARKKWVGSEFNCLQRLAIIRSTDHHDVKLIFDRITQVEVRSKSANQFSQSAIDIITAQKTYTIAEAWERWKAEELAQRIGGIVQCPAIAPNGASLEPILTAGSTPIGPLPKDNLTIVTVFQLAISGTLIAGFVFALAFAINTANLANRPLTKPVPITGPTFIAINQTGDLHIYSRFLTRIQIFNSDGKFQRSISTKGISSKYGLFLCGGGQHPILTYDNRGKLYNVQTQQRIYRKPNQVPQFCRQSQSQAVATWNDRIYSVKGDPPNIVMRQGKVERVMIKGAKKGGFSLSSETIVSGIVGMLVLIGVMGLINVVMTGLRDGWRAVLLPSNNSKN